MQVTGTGLDNCDPQEIADLFALQRNFLYIFGEDYLKQCLLDSVDECPFIDFLSQRKRTTLRVRPLDVNMVFLESEYAQENDVSYLQLSNKDIETHRTHIISEIFVSRFIDRVIAGLQSEKIEEALKIYKMDKKKIGVIFSSIMSITMEEMDSSVRGPQERISFSFRLFV